MKIKSKQVLSLILTLAMLFSAAFQSTNFKTSADESTESAAAATEALKTAWQNLTLPVSSNFYPLACHKNDNFNANLNAVFYGSEKAPFDATHNMLGDYYAKFNFKEADQEAHLIGFFKNNWHEYGLADLTEYRDMYFYLYVSEVKTSGVIKQIFFDKSESKNITGKEIKIDKSVTGKWIRISAADMFDGGYSYICSALENSMKIVRISVSNGLDADAVLGSIVFEKSVELPDGSENWSSAEWLTAAEAIDTEKYGNTAEFIRARDALKKVLGSDLTYLTGQLKQKWQAMTEAVSSNFYPLACHKNDNFNANLNAVFYGSEKAPFDATHNMLGDYYAKFNFKEADQEAHLIGFFKNNWHEYGLADLTEYRDMYFYLYVSEVKTSGVIKQIFFDKSESKNITGKEIKIDKSVTGKWIRISAADMFDGGYSYICSALENSMKIVRISVSNGLDADAVLGSIMFEKNVELPDGSENWSSAEWLTAAEAIDTEKYGNTAEFIKARDSLKSALGTDEDYLAAILKRYWKAMKHPVSSNFYPMAYHVNDNFNGILDYKVFNADTAPYNASFETVGSYYCSLNFKDASTNGERLIGYFKNDWHEYGLADLKNYSDMYFYIYVGAVNTPGTLKAIFYNSNESKSVVSKEIHVTSDKSGKWIKVSAADMFDGGYSYICSSLENTMKIVRLSVSNGLDADAVLGSVMFIENLSLPEGSEKWSNSELYLAAKELNTDNCTGVEDFKKALEELGKNLNSDELKAVELKRALKNGWQDMTIIDGGQLSPYRININSEWTALDIKSSITSLPEGAAYDTVGQKYASMAFNDENNVNTVSNSKVRLFVECDISGASAKIYPTRNKDVYISVRVDKLVSPGGMGFQFVCSDGYCFESEVEITAADVGKWKKYSVRSLLGDDFDKIWQDNVLLQRLQIGPTKGLKANITVGSVITLQSQSAPDGYDDWNLAECVLAAKKLDLKNFGNTDSFKAALTAAEKLVSALGMSAFETENSDLSNLAEEKLNGNILNGLTPEVIFFDGKNEQKKEYESIGYLNDGSAEKEICLENSYSDGAYTDIIYSLGKAAEIGRIMLIGSAEAEARIGEYEVYISNSREDLFAESNRVISFKNSAASEVQSFKFDESLKLGGAYAAIRIVSPGGIGAERKVRLKEFGIYGKTENYTVETGNFNSLRIKSIGNNLLDGIAPKLKANKSNAPWNYGDYSRFTDCDPSTAIMVNPIYWRSEDGYSIDIYYDLGELYLMNKFLFNSFGMGFNNTLQIGKYEIYVSEEIHSLFYADSKVASYDNTQSSTVSQLFKMANSGVIGRYVAFKITLPVTDYNEVVKLGNEAITVRLSELGVYGAPYSKPAYQTNLAEHVPVEIYRTNAAGKHTLVGEEEVNGEQIASLYDGDYGKAVNIKRNGEQLDIILNLCSNVELDAVALRTLTKSVKELKIYATNVYDNIWDDDTLVYSYWSNTPETDKLGKSFTSRLTARYLRFSVISGTSDIADITEIEALGLSNQALSYYNLAMNNENNIAVYYQNKSTSKAIAAPNSTKRWAGSLDKYFSFASIVDGEYDTLYDFMGGINNKESVNLVLDLGVLSAIDNVSLYSGSNGKYRPSKLNIYISDDQKKLFSADAEPIKSFDSISEDGYYNYSFASKMAKYVRFEILETANPYYNDMIIAVISELAVKGIGVKGRTSSDSVYSYTDKDSGITVDILSKYESDVYEKVQNISFVKRLPNNAEKTQARAYDMAFYNNVYEVKFLDSKGNAVTDLEERSIRIRIPLTDSMDLDSSYVAIKDGGVLRLSEQQIEEIDGKYYLTVLFTSPNDIFFAPVHFADEEPANDDNGRKDDTTVKNDDMSYHPDDGADENKDSEQEPEDNQDDTQKKRRKRVVVKRSGGSDNSLLVWIIAAVCAAVAAGGTVLIIIIIKKKRSKKQ